jgi:predicted acetyltransferase
MAEENENIQNNNSGIWSSIISGVSSVFSSGFGLANSLISDRNNYYDSKPHYDPITQTWSNQSVVKKKDYTIWIIVLIIVLIITMYLIFRKK